MQELVLCHRLLRRVGAIAAQHRATAVHGVTVRLDPRAGVRPEVLARMFTRISAGTIAAQARLDIRPTPVRMRCLACGSESDADGAPRTCPACGSTCVRSTEEAELLLVSVDLAHDQRQAADNVQIRASAWPIRRGADPTGTEEETRQCATIAGAD